MGTTRLTFNIPNLHCENCERRVRAIVEALPGLKSVDPSAESGTLTVVLDADSATDEQSIRDALAAGDYPAT